MDSRYSLLAPEEFERQFNPRVAVPDLIQQDTVLLENKGEPAA